MADYTNTELADMHLVYEVADYSGTAAQLLYKERYLTRHIVSHNFFVSLHQRLAETNSFQRAGRIVWTLATEQNVLQQVQETPSMSKQSLEHAARVSSFSIWRILRKHIMHLFLMQHV